MGFIINSYATNNTYGVFVAHSVPFNITTSGFSYNIDQIGTSNPSLTCYRETNYDFIINTSSHPLALREDSLNTTSEISGTYNNDILNGKSGGKVIMFTPNSLTPSLIIYQCTVHPSMSGTITVLNQ
jgi:hypothetical protein